MAQKDPDAVTNEEIYAMVLELQQDVRALLRRGEAAPPALHKRFSRRASARPRCSKAAGNERCMGGVFTKCANALCFQHCRVACKCDKTEQ